MSRRTNLSRDRSPQSQRGGIDIADDVSLSTGGLFNQTRLEQFRHYVAERQRIWAARNLRKEPPPWTIDPILSSQRFTNVYRELDPGTVYARTEILENAAAAPDRVFNIMLYRLIGRKETHRALGFQKLETFDSKGLETALKLVRESGQPTFTAAYMVSGYRSMGSRDKIVNVSRLFGRLHNGFDEFYPFLARAVNLPAAYATVRSRDGFGNFLAYQILVDLMYPIERDGGRGILPFTPDQWAAAGPGAQKGIGLLTGGSGASDLSVMRWLRSHQRSEFERLSIGFEYLRDSRGVTIEISLANIQNCLCEFYKYEKIREGTGRGRRLFRPSPVGSSPDELGSENIGAF
ncbi:MAG: hypothetical protein L3K10_03270 [Thermoplasmata archaeon]|nr:hypothetical protein [Thermoplasmata archaeon]